MYENRNHNKNLKKKETFWLIGTILFVIVFFFGSSGFKNFDLTGSADINLHETYYVVPSIHVFILTATLIFFMIYLIRMVRRNFKNLTANLIFMISNITLILIFTFLIILANGMREIPGTTEYPPLSGGIIENAGNGWNDVYYVLLVIQLILIILLTLSGIKTGLNYKRAE
jgi:heme/copper-type cytochrome/quinol oxidase subunit 1